MKTEQRVTFEWEWWVNRFIWCSCRAMTFSLLHSCEIYWQRPTKIISEIRKKGVKKNTLFWLDHSQITHSATTMTTAAASSAKTTTTALIYCIFGFGSRAGFRIVSPVSMFSNVPSINRRWCDEHKTKRISHDSNKSGTFLHVKNITVEFN